MLEHIDSWADTGLTDKQIDLLSWVGCYYLGARFNGESEVRQLGVHNPPQIEFFLQFIDGASCRKPYDKEIRHLKESDLMRRERLLQNTVDWAPSQKARHLIKKNILPKHESHISDTLIQDDGDGLVIDADETITHRLGVEVARRAVPQMDWADGLYKIYPGHQGQSRPDIQIHWGDRLVNIEVLTQYTSNKHRSAKLRSMQNWGGPVMLVFDNRAAANRCLNNWQKTHRFNVRNFPISNPEDRALQNVNEYLDKSRGSEHEDTCNIWSVHTINELHRDYIRD